MLFISVCVSQYPRSPKLRLFVGGDRPLAGEARDKHPPLRSTSSSMCNAGLDVGYEPVPAQH